jgi:hypothetical protein
MDPVRDDDRPGAVCYRVTPELYLGYQRGVVGNTAGLAPDKPSTYTDPGKHMTARLPRRRLAARGEYGAARGASSQSRLTVPYGQGREPVIHPPTYGGSAPSPSRRTRAAHDRDAGADVAPAGDIRAHGRRRRACHRRHRGIDRHELTLTTTSDGVALYAFTFASCLVPGEEDRCT